jgi:hypothetical protein
LPDVLLLLTTSSPVQFFSTTSKNNIMTQTAAALSNDHALNIHELPSTTTLFVKTTTTESLTKSGQQEPLNEVAISDGTFYRSETQLKYGDKVKLSFSVKETYRTHFILIKGLLEFHRPPGFVFSYNKQESTFEVTASSAGILQPLESLNKFLRKVAAWLDQEISFKRQLKDMMAFEREYRAKLAKVYAGGDGFTLIRAS